MCRSLNTSDRFSASSIPLSAPSWHRDIAAESASKGLNRSPIISSYRKDQGRSTSRRGPHPTPADSSSMVQNIPLLKEIQWTRRNGLVVLDLLSCGTAVSQSTQTSSFPPIESFLRSSFLALQTAYTGTPHQRICLPSRPPRHVTLSVPPIPVCPGLALQLLSRCAHELVAQELTTS
jgi:hypothetical protein